MLKRDFVVKKSFKFGGKSGSKKQNKQNKKNNNMKINMKIFCDSTTAHIHNPIQYI